jgi:hypothetical protein
VWVGREGEEEKLKIIKFEFGNARERAVYLTRFVISHMRNTDEPDTLI